MNETAWNSQAAKYLIKIHYSIESIFASFYDITGVQRKELKNGLTFQDFTERHVAKVNLSRKHQSSNKINFPVADFFFNRKEED